MVNKVIHNDPELEAMMRTVCPVQGDGFLKLIRVELDQGDSIAPHEHREHTVLYYPQRADPVIVTPGAGTLLYLSPGTTHAVPVVDRPRLSYAMLVNE